LFLPVLAVITALLLGCSLSAHAGDLTIHKMGLRLPTAKNLAWIAAHMTKTRQVALNDIGVQRVNDARRAQGLPPLDARQAVPRGMEVTDATRAGALCATSQGGPALPGSVDNSQLKYFPPIGDQAQLGSCAAFSTTYYTMSHMVALARNLDAKNGGDDLHYSPKWTYNIINGGGDFGAYITDAYQVQLDHGAATWKDFPYVGTPTPAQNYLGWCTDPAVWRKAINVRMNQAGYVDSVDTNTGLTALKSLLANGYICNYSTFIEDWQYQKITAEPGSTDNNPYIGQYACHYATSGYNGSHAMTVVGYNDNLWIDVNGNGQVDTGEKGAFLIANNWSTSWGNNGFMWVSYDALQATSAVTNGPTVREPIWYAATVFWITARSTYTPSYVANYALHATDRSQLKVQVGTSTQSQTTPAGSWTPFVLQGGTGGSLNFEGVANTADDGGFVVDFTDIAPSTKAPTRWHLPVSNTNTTAVCTVTDFKLTAVAANVTVTAKNIPQTAETGSSSYASSIDPYIDYPISTSLAITKSVTPSAAQAGSTCTYTLNYSNTGNATATNVTVTDTIPANMTYVTGSATGSGSYASATQTLSWLLGALKAGGSGAVTFSTTINAGVPIGANMDNTAAISALEAPQVTSNTATVSVTAGPQPSLTLTKAVVPSSVQAGGTVTYSLTYANTGTAAASKVCLSDTVPANMTYVNGSATGGGVYTPATQSLTWAIGVLSVNGTGTKTFKATVNTGTAVGTNISNTALVSCAETTAVSSNMAVVSVVAIPLPTLTLTKAVSPASAVPGGTVSYTVNYANTGTVPATNVTVSDTIPANLTYLTGTATGGCGYNAATRTISWPIGTLNAGVSGAMMFKASVNYGTAAGTTINNNAGISCAEIATVMSNIAAVTVPAPGLTLAKTALPSVVRPGDVISFSLTYKNTGVQATNVVMTDTLPSSLTYVAGSANNTPSYNAATHTLTWRLGTIPVGGTAASSQVTFKATVSTATPLGTTLTNCAAITSNEITTPVTSNTTSTLVSAPSLSLAKTVTPTTTCPGGVITFTINYANSGNWYATNVVITDVLPAHITPVTGALGGGVYNAATRAITWAPGTLNAGAAGSVSFKATVDSTTKLGSVIANTASVLCAELTNPITSSVAVTVSHPAGGRGDWWMFMHDPQHTGRNAAYGPTIPGQRWAFPTGDVVESSATFGKDGTIFIGSADHHLYALNPDGTQKWAFAAGGSIGFSTPTIAADGTIYLGANDGTLYALYQDGTPKWTFSLGGTIDSSPLIGTDGTIYLGSSTGSLCAVNPDGTQKWAFATGGEIHGSPALGADGTIYIGSYDSEVYAIKPDGTAKWTRPFATGDAIFASPTIARDGTIYIGSQDGNLYAIRPDGLTKWSQPVATSAPIYATVALTGNGVIYLPADNLYAVNPDSTLRWMCPTGGSHGSPAIDVNGTVYLGGADGNLYAVNPDGTLRWTVATGDAMASSPALDPNGVIYVGSDDGKIYAIGGSVKPAFALTKSAQPLAARIGDAVTFTICYANNGNIPATKTVLTDVLSAGFTYLPGSASNVPTYDATSRTLTWALGTIPVGNAGLYYRITFKATIDPGTSDGASLTNTAGIACAEVPLPFTSNAATVSVVAMPTPVLSLAKVVSNTTPCPGSTVTYTLTYGNAGTAGALGATITDVLPANLTYVQGSAAGALYFAATRTLSWSLGTVNVGTANLTVSFKAIVNTAAPLGTTITNTATLTGSGVSPVSSNAVDVTVTAPPLTLVKSTLLDKVPQGHIVIYYLTYNYTGATSVTNTKLVDILPAHLTYVPGSATNGGVYNAGTRTLTWSLGTLSAGQGAQTLTFRATVDTATATGTVINNTAGISSAEVPTVTSNNATVTVIIGSARGDWWMFHHDVKHTGRSPFTGPFKPMLKWTFTAYRIFDSSPVLGADGTVYIGAEDGNLYALNANGTQKWAFATGAKIFACPALGVDGTVYVSSINGNFYAINPDGTQQWIYATGNFNSSPAVGADGTVYVGSYDHNVYAFNPDGSKRWVFAAGNTIESAPVIGDDGTVYISAEDSYLYAINPDGTQKWAFATGDKTIYNSSPTLGADGTVYVVSDDGNLYAVQPDGTRKWAYAIGCKTWASSPVVGVDGTVYVGSEDGNFYAVKADGTKKWTLAYGNYINSSPAIGTDGTIYFGCWNYNLYAVNPDGTQKWVFPTGGEIHSSSPAIGPDGTIYIGSGDGKLYAITSAPPVPVLALTKSVSPTSARRGDQVTYTLTYQNTGTKAAGNVQLSDVLPAHITYLPGSGGSYNAATRTVSWSSASLSMGTSVKVTFKATLDADVIAGMNIVNTAIVSCAEIPVALSSNTTNVLVLLTPGPALTLAKAVTPFGAAPGATVTYTLKYGNTGTKAATKVTLTDILPAHITYVPGSATGGGAYAAATNTLTWVPGILNVGGSAVVTFQATVNNDVATGASIINAAQITCAEISTPVVSNVAVIIVTQPGTGRSEWWKFHHDEYHTGQSIFNGPKTPTLKWKVYMGGGNSSPSIGVDGMIYEGSWDNNLYAINPDGTIKWVYKTAATIDWTSPTIMLDGTSYIGSYDKNLYAINADGTKKWAFTTGGGIGANVNVAGDGTIYFVSDKLYALMADGTKKWSAGVGNVSYGIEFPTTYSVSSPAIGPDGSIFLGANDNTLYAFNPDGSPKWIKPFGSTGIIQGITGDPTVGPDGVIYVGSNDKNYYAVNPDGTQKWVLDTGGYFYSCPAIGTDGVTYIGSEANKVCAINPDGTVKWTFTGQKGFGSSPAIDAKKNIYIGGEDGNVYALNPDGTQKWVYHIGGIVYSSPAIGVDGTLYICAEDGYLYAFADAPPPALILNKSVSSSTAPRGATITYTLDVANSGRGSATNVVLTDVLPANLAYVAGSASGGGVYTAATRTLSWSLGALTFGAGARLTFKATVNANAVIGANITNTAGISCTECPAPVSSTATFTVITPRPVLTLSKTVSPANAKPGDRVTYTLSCMNTGTATASSVALSDVLPVHLVYLQNSATRNGSYTLATRTLAWSLGSLSVGSSASVTFQATIDATAASGANITNSALVHCQEVATPVSSNIATITVIAPALALTKTVSPTSAKPGDTITYTLAVVNTGIAATNVTLTDALPAKITYVTGSATRNGAYTTATRTLTWSLGTLNAAASATVTFKTTINAGTAVGTNIANTASIKCTEVPAPVVSNAAMVVVKIPAGRGDWWMLQHDPQHTGRSSSMGPGTPVTKWTFPVGAPIHASPVIGKDGTIFVVSDDQYLYALNLDGTQKWKFFVGTQSNSTPAICSDGTLIVTGSSRIYEINQDGTQKSVSPIYIMANWTSPAIGTDDTVYLSSNTNLEAFIPDVKSKWQFPPSYGNPLWGAIESSPTIGKDGTIYIGMDPHYFYALNPDGTTKWATPFVTGGKIRTGAVIGSDGTIYVGSDDGNLYAINPDQSVKWVKQIGNSSLISAAPAIGSDGSIYLGAEDANLYAFNPDGSAKWLQPFTTGSNIKCSPIIGADGTIYIASDKVYALNQNGTSKWTNPFSSGSVFSSYMALGPDGTIYIGGTDNKLYAIGNGIPGPALTLTKSVTPTTAPAGATVTYTLAYANTGTASATNVTLTDTLPAHLTYTPGSATGGGTFSASALTWSLGTLNAGATATVTVQATVNNSAASGTNIANTASISCTEVSAPVVSNAATVAVVGASTGARGDWWMLGHDPQHTGRSAFTGPSTAKLKWTYTAGGPVSASPSIGCDGTIYIGAEDNKLYALNPDGTAKWALPFATGAAIALAAPAIATDGTIYFGSDDDKFYAVNPDGTKKWSYTTGMTIVSSPVIAADGTVYVGAYDNNVYAFNPDGTKKWAYKTGYYVTSSPALGSDGTIYIGSCDGNLYALNPNGTKKWAFATGVGIQFPSATIGADGTIYIGSQDNNLYAINPNGTKKWAFNTGNDHVISTAAAIGTDGAIYFGAYKKLYALNPNGTQKWTYPVGDSVLSAPAIGKDGLIYFGSGDYNVYAVTPNGTLKWSSTTGYKINSSPAIGPDGTLYIGSRDAKVYAFSTPLPALSLANSVTPTSADPGATLTYTLSYANTGSSAASNVTLTDTLPLQITYTPGSATGGGSFTVATRTLAWSLGNLNAGATAQVTFQAVVANGTASGINIANTASIYCTEVLTPVVSNVTTVTVSGAVSGGRGDWWMFQHDLHHSGRSPYTGPQTALKKWTFATGQQIQSTAAIGTDGTIYIGSNDYKLYAINPDGTQKWAFATGNYVTSSPALGTDGTIYVGSYDHNFYAINPNGTEKWAFATGSSIFSSPVLGSDSTIYIGANDDKLYAINPNGTQKWAFKTGDLVRSAPAIGADGTIYVGSEDKKLYAINPDGTKKWDFVTGSNIWSDPAIGADGTIYVGSDDDHLYAVNPNGLQKWTFATGDWIRSSPAIGADGTIYVGSFDKNLYAVNPNGTKKWAFATGGSIYSSPAIGVDGLIYLGSNDHNLYAINPNGTQKWVFAIGDEVWSSFAIGEDGTLYVGLIDKKLYAFNDSATGSMLKLTKSVTPTSVPAGATLTYTLSYANTGSSAASNVTLTDALPAHLTYTSGSATGGGTFSASALTWSLGTLNAGATATVTFQAVVANGTASGTNIANTASISCTEVSASVVSNVATVTVVGLAPAGRGDWWLFHHDPQHTGRSPFTGPATATKKWAFNCGEIQFSSPAIGLDGTIYIGCYNHNLFAMNPDGSEKWAFATGGQIDSSPALGTDGTVYIGSSDHSLYALNPDGTKKWSFITSEQIIASPVIGTDGIIYTGSIDGIFRAIKNDGTQKWTYTTGGPIWGCPAIAADGTIYFGSDRKLYALNPNGTNKWSYQTNGMILSAPAIGSDGTVYVGSLDGNLYALDPNGTKKWVFASGFSASGGSLTSSPAIGVDGTIYIGSLVDHYDGNDYHLYAVNQNGTKKWIFTAGDTLPSSPALDANGTIYIGSRDGNFYAINPDGTKKWGFGTKSYIYSSPAIGPDGTIYVGSYDGNLYAIGSSVPAAKPTLTLTKSVTPTNTAAGATVTYTLAYANTGTASATNVTLTDTLPAHLTYTSGSASNGGTFSASALTWSLGTLNAGASATVTFQAVVSNGTATGTNVVNTASIYCTEVSTPVVSNAAMVTVSGSTSGARGDWWMFAHDPQHTGRSPVSGPQTAKLKWKFNAMAEVLSTPVFAADGTLYLPVSDKRIYALNPDGTTRWAKPFYTNGANDSTPAIGTDGTIYFGSGDANVYALNPDGTKKWSFTTGARLWSSPVIGTDGTIYLSSMDNNLYALNPNGTQKWAYATGNQVYSSPALGTDGTIYVGSEDKSVYALNPNGTQKWAYFTGSTIQSSPAVGSDGTIYIGSTDENLYALTPNGTLKWLFTTRGEIISSPAIGMDGTIYVGSQDHSLYAINPNGTKKWAFATGSLIMWPSPAIGADGVVYIASDDKSLYAVNPNGTQKWSYATTDLIYASPVIGPDGTVYISSIDNYLYAIGGNAPTAQPSFTLTKSVTPTNAAAGATVTYTLAYANTGTANATNVTLTDTLPAHLTYTSGSASSGGTFSASALTWSLGTLNAGASATVTFQAVVSNGTATGTNIANTASISCTEVSAPVVSNAATVTVVGSTSGARGDWWMFHHDMQHTGRSAYTGPIAGVKKWVVSTGNSIYSSPAIASDGTIYIGSNDMNLYAVNPNGTKKWSFATSGGVSPSPAIGTDGTIYVGSWDGKLYAINPNGSKKWSFTTQQDIESSPTIGTDGTIYIGSWDTKLYAVNPNGSKKWAFATNGEIHSFPAIGTDGTLYVGSDDNKLYAINPNGSLKWSFTTGNVVYPAPTIGADGTIYAGSNDHKLYAINPDGSSKWTFTTGGKVESSPALGSDGVIYVTSTDAKLYALNPNGTLKWSYTTGVGIIGSSPAIGTNGYIYFGSEDHNINAIKLNGTFGWSFNTGDSVRSSPALGADGTLYVGSFDGKLYAIGN